MNFDSSKTTSYSHRKVELIKQRWVQLLLSWLNRCVHPKTPVTKLNNKSLVDVIYKYKQDICDDAIQRSILDSDDVELFIRYNYPLLKLKYLCDDKDKKLYIMTAVLMYHCCVSSINGQVDSDICAYLDRSEQKMILEYCERLTDMLVTVNNVDCAIRGACETVRPVEPKSQPKVKILPNKYATIGPGEACQTLGATTKPPTSWGLAKLSPSSISESSKNQKVCCDSSVTALPPVLAENSVYSESQYVVNYDSVVELTNIPKTFATADTQISHEFGTKDFVVQSTSSEFVEVPCMPPCIYPECNRNYSSSGDTEIRKKTSKKKKKTKNKNNSKRKKYPKKKNTSKKKKSREGTDIETSVKNLAKYLRRAAETGPGTLKKNLSYYHNRMSGNVDKNAKKYRRS